ncbi:hypothetical protein IVU49_09130 [Salmonella enterica subsp. enterica serovar Worthington]|nr:hypothetical protein [Salmonella enterica subsp. enterica serovar Worthington]
MKHQSNEALLFTLVQRWDKVIYGQPYYQIYIRAMEKQDAQRTTQGKTPPFKKCQRLRLPLSLSNAADI